MSKKEQTINSMPSVDQLKAELKRENYKNRYSTVIKSTFFYLVVVAAIAVLVSTLWMPVLQIYGASMTPTLNEGEIVVAVKGSELETGDLIAFYYGNKLLVKRVIASPGQWVTIDEEGYLYIDGELIDEPYISERSLGECDLEFPYQVPSDKWFVMGDHRSTSVDSRSTTVGCISEEQIVGEIIYRVWPLKEFGKVD